MPIQPLEKLPPDLANIQREIEGYAREYGLDFFTTVFEMVSHDQLNEIAAFGGFPVRYPHWRFGMQYEELSKSYSYGLSKIYEMVINNDPCYAYLMKSNGHVDQKLVMAHVYGHCDFFKNNAWFSQTSRKMMDETANHGQRIIRHMERLGQEEVETFIDACLSIEDLIDIHSPFIQRYEPSHRYDFTPDETDPDQPARFKAKGYMDSYINPPGALAAEAERLKKKHEEAPHKFPAEPQRDVMLFILEHAPLKPWQADVLATIRDEAYYFAPQAQTKIMNEGWASYWHSTIMTRQGLTAGEVIDYADHHSGTMATYGGRLNPYKLGIELYRHIEDRWNKGQFGKDWSECDDWRAKQDWDTKAGLGRQKIFEVRRIHNDLTFIDEFLTPEFCHEQKLFSFGFNDEAETYEIEGREFPKIKERLLFNLTNLGRPHIDVRDGNHRNRGELLLRHHFNGVELRYDYARDTLVNLHRLWGRPVHIETVRENHHMVLSFDGTRHGEEKGKPVAES
jgi:stage V sporulation protein R